MCCGETALSQARVESTERMKPCNLNPAMILLWTPRTIQLSPHHLCSCRFWSHWTLPSGRRGNSVGGLANCLKNHLKALSQTYLSTWSKYAYCSVRAQPRSLQPQALAARWTLLRQWQAALGFLTRALDQLQLFIYERLVVSLPISHSFETKRCVNCLGTWYYSQRSVQIQAVQSSRPCCQHGKECKSQAH